MTAAPAPGGPWLVVVDMQRVFADADSEWRTPGYADASAGIQRLLPRYENRTVYTRFVAPDRPWGAWVPYYRQWPFALRPPSDPLWRITREFDTDDAPVVSLPSFGKWGPELAGIVGHGREIVLTGVSTDCCVLSTALAAADAGVHVQVAADACAGLTPEDHRRALDAMALYAPLIEITTVDRLLAGASALPAPPAVP